MAVGVNVLREEMEGRLAEGGGAQNVEGSVGMGRSRLRGATGGM